MPNHSISKVDSGKSHVSTIDSTSQPVIDPKRKTNIVDDSSLLKGIAREDRRRQFTEKPLHSGHSIGKLLSGKQVCEGAITESLGTLAPRLFTFYSTAKIGIGSFSYYSIILKV